MQNKERVSINNITSYQLGIIWSIGSYDDIDNRILFRHQNKYFLEQLNIFENTIYPQKARTGIQYCLKTCLLDIEKLKEIGWTERNTKQRNLPILNDYKDFLRSYFEIHSKFGWQTTYTRKKQKYYRIKLRVYGNEVLIESINNLLSELRIIEKKKIQNTTNETTKYLSLTDLEELIKLFEYLDGEPKCQEYWNEVDYYMKNPRKW